MTDLNVNHSTKIDPAIGLAMLYLRISKPYLQVKTLFIRAARSAEDSMR